MEQKFCCKEFEERAKEPLPNFKKHALPRNGLWDVKGCTILVNIRYCPFCGEKLQ